MIRSRWVVAMLFLAGGAIAAEEAAVTRGRAIAEDAQRRGEGFGDVVAEAQMRIRNGRGQEAIRSLGIRILDLPGDAGRALTVVTAPKDVKGTALLTHTDAAGESEQWLYLPSVGRVKRIASSGRSGPFMGSEFSFEDFSAQTPDKYEFRLLREEKLGADDCYVLERRARDPKQTSYGAQTVWLDKAQLRVLRVDFFDRQQRPLKQLTASGFKLYDGKYWRADRLLMRNLRTGAETELGWSKVRLRTGLTERDFDVNSLAAAH